MKFKNVIIKTKQKTTHINIHCQKVGGALPLLFKVGGLEPPPSATHGSVDIICLATSYGCVSS